MENSRRLSILRCVVGAALLAGLAFSHELWFPVARTFPRAPVFAAFPVWSERLLTTILAVSLGAVVLMPRRKIIFGVALAALMSLILGDQTRLQPWVYQYSVLIGVFALHDETAEDRDGAAERTLALAQILIASLYVWSGVQKLNYTFAHETLPKLLETFVTAGDWPLGALGVAVAAGEIALGLGLLARKTRNGAVCGVAAMHLAILFLLVAKDYNRIVWLWNAALIALVAAAFWRSRLPLAAARRGPNDRRGAAGKALVAAAVALPALSFVGLWDLYLSGALYSGNAEIAAVRTNESLLAGLPPAARAVVIETKNGERWLPLVEWALAETRVPAPPARRVSRAVAREVCRKAVDRNGVELIVRERPAMTDGSYKIAREPCAGL